jgi:hypothetical protein
MIHPDISAAAQQVAAAVAQHQRAAEGLAQADASRAQVAERLAEFDNQRAAIIARHRAGNGHPDDPGRVALLDADRADLASMLADADGVVAAARVAVQEAGSALAMARAHFQCSEDELTEATLIEHIGRLDGLMTETLRQLGELGTRLGRGKAAWGPSAELWGGLRRIQAGRGLL